MKKGLYIMVDANHSHYKQWTLLELTHGDYGICYMTDGNYSWGVFDWRIEYIGEI